MIDILLYICLGLWVAGFLGIFVSLFREYSPKLQTISALFLTSGIFGTLILGFYRIFLLFKELYLSMNG